LSSLPHLIFLLAFHH